MCIRDSCTHVCDIVQRMVTAEGVLNAAQLCALRDFLGSLPSGMRTKVLQRKLNAIIARATADGDA